MTDSKEVDATKEIEVEKANEDEKKSEIEDKEKTEEKEEAEKKEKIEDKVEETEDKEEANDKMETDDKEKGDDDDKKDEEVVASKAKTTKKRKKDDSVKATEDDGEDKEESATVADGRPKREKRVRKSADVFEPDNFLGKDKSLQVVAGRGTKLAEIAACKATIDKLSMNSSELMLAHRLLYTRQGKPAKKEIKKNLLEFCGFLPQTAEGQDKKELEALDEEAEVRIIQYSEIAT
jgi:hypothetical protein